MKFKKTIIAVVIIVAVISLIIAAGAARRAVRPETVKAAVITKGDITSYLSTTAQIESKMSKEYPGMTQLTVKRVFVEVGDTVKKGDILLEYDTYDLSAAVRQARLQYDNTVLQRDDLKKQQKLSPLAVSAEKLKQVDIAVELAALSLESAQTKYNKYRSGIIAEFDGTVTEMNASAGLAVSVAQPAVVISQLDNLKAVILLGKYDAQKVKKGQEAVISSGDQSYKGVVSIVYPAASVNTTISGQETVLRAEIDISAAGVGEALKVGFDANIDILLSKASGVPVIPVECIKYDKDGNSSAFIIDDENKARLVDLELGIQSDTEAQLIGGLSEGDAVILNPSVAIQDGTLVKVTE